MSFVLEPRKLPPALALAVLLVAGCELADNGTGSATGNTFSVDGTGTSTGNTISSLVLNPDGKPAAAARVILRPMGYVPDTLGISESSGPGSRLDTVTDADGRFTFDKLAAGNYLIECFRDLPKTTLVSWTENVLLAKDQIRNLEPLRLDTATGLTGRADITDTAGKDNLWVGFPGTERFARLGPDLRFTLPVFPKNRKAFTLYRKRPAGDWQQITVGGWKFKEDEIPPGAPRILAPFTLPSLASQDTSINVSDTVAPPDTTKPDPAKQAVFCPEAAPDTLIQDRAQSPSPQNLLIRSVMTGFPNLAPDHLIELDPCKGSWRIVKSLGSQDPNPGIIAFSSRGADFFPLGDTKTAYIRVDTATTPNAVTSHTDASFAGLTGVVNHKGKYYAQYGSTEVAVYSDTSFLYGGGAPEDRIPVEGPTNLSGMAILGDVMYCYMYRGADPGFIFRFDLVSRQPSSFVLQGPDSASVMVGLTKASESALWLLTIENRLLLWDTTTRRPIKTYVIAAPENLRALTRNPD